MKHSKVDLALILGGLILDDGVIAVATALEDALLTLMDQSYRDYERDNARSSLALARVWKADAEKASEFVKILASL